MQTARERDTWKGLGEVYAAETTTSYSILTVVDNKDYFYFI